MRPAKNISGLVFNRLTVTDKSFIKKGRTIWECKCQCGNIVFATVSDLVSNNTKSCGCLRKEIVIKRNISHTKAQRKQKHEIYHIWQHMKDRCLNPKSKFYFRYGGRGIKVCQRWKNSFANFLTDMGERPSKSHSLERKKNNGNYTKLNCKWATAKEQAANRRPPRKRK